jgi:hypothetical protein
MHLQGKTNLIQERDCILGNNASFRVKSAEFAGEHVAFIFRLVDEVNL